MVNSLNDSDVGPPQSTTQEHQARDPAESIPQRERNCTCAQPPAGGEGRKLIVAFDGTSNRFGRKNTNVIEMYARIEKNDNQRTYYNSGIGTYAKPSWRSWTYWKTVINNKIDLALAWNFEKIVLGGYRWLSENYQPGDQIFLFGFSRGAYQARVLAGMIDRVGLIFPGNEEQIPFAYELYADSDSGKTAEKPKVTDASNIKEKTLGEIRGKGLKPIKRTIQTVSSSFKRTAKKLPSDEYNNSEMAQRFKETFSRENVRTHFVGVWDTVSSVGFGRRKALPLAHSYEHICFFRHALALDECRVKFLPEYIHEGVSIVQSHTNLNPRDPRGHLDLPSRKGRSKAAAGIPATSKRTNVEGDHTRPASNLQGDGTGLEGKEPGQPRVKEVWFAGTHSDVGGGIKNNDKLDVGDVPSLWIGNEVMMAGLALKPSRVEWDWEELETAKPTPSLTTVWKLLEYLPLKRLTYNTPRGTTRRIHQGQGRIIQPGQLIHASVAFKQNGYTPKAVFSNDICLSEMQGKSWDDIIGQGHQFGVELASSLAGIMEMDLFDHSRTKEILNEIESQRGNALEYLKRLSHLASYEQGAGSIIIADTNLQTLIRVLNSGTLEAKFLSAIVIYRVAGHRTGRLYLKDSAHSGIISCLCKFVSVSNDNSARSVALAVLAMLNDNSQDTGKAITDLAEVRAHIVNTKPTAWIERVLDGNSKARRFAAEGLLWLASHDPEPAIVNTSTIGSLARMLKSEDRQERTSAKRALSYLAEHDDSRAAILRTDAIPWLAGMLKSEDSEWSAASTLRRLATHGDIRTAILRTDTIPSLVGMLKREDSKWSPAAGTLIDLAKHDDSRAAILRTDAIPWLAEMLKSEDSEWSAAIALRILAKHDDIRAAILCTDAIPWLAGMLKSKDSSMQRSAADTLWSLSQCDDIRAAILCTDAIPSFVEMLKSKDSAWSAASILIYLAKHDNSRAAILRTKTIPSLAGMLKSKVSYVQSSAASTLVDLAEHDDLRAPILRTVAILSLAGMLKHKNSYVQRSAANALSNIAEHDDIRAAILCTGAIPSFVEMLKSKDSAWLAASILIYLAKHDDSRAAILRADAIPWLAGMLKSKDSGMQRLAAKVVGDFAEHGNTRAAMLITDTICSLAKMLIPDGEILDSAAQALSKFSEHRDMFPSIRQSGALETLSTMFQRQDLSRRTQHIFSTLSKKFQDNGLVGPDADNADTMRAVP